MGQYSASAGSTGAPVGDAYAPRCCVCGCSATRTLVSASANTAGGGSASPFATLPSLAGRPTTSRPAGSAADAAGSRAARAFRFGFSASSAGGTGGAASGGGGAASCSAAGSCACVSAKAEAEVPVCSAPETGVARPPSATRAGRGGRRAATVCVFAACARTVRAVRRSAAWDRIRWAELRLAWRARGEGVGARRARVCSRDGCAADLALYPRRHDPCLVCMDAETGAFDV
jgi:hypothetical protein